jgi:uncharacterized protein YgiM (DUF1202 family)
MEVNRVHPTDNRRFSHVHRRFLKTRPVLSRELPPNLKRDSDFWLYLRIRWLMLNEFIHVIGLWFAIRPIYRAYHRRGQMKLKSKVFSLFLLFSLLVALSVSGGGVLAAETEQRSQFAAPILVVNTSFLNIRTGPGAHFTVLLTVVGGTELPVLGVARDLVWYQVSTAAGVGWVNVQYTLPRGDFTHVPFAEAPPVDPGLVVPGVSDQVPVDDSVQVGFVSGRGWGLSVRESHPARPQPTIFSSSPGTAIADSTVIYTILESAANEGQVWFRVDIPHLGQVWVEGTKTRMRPFACDMTAVAMERTVAPRQGPDGSGTLTGEVSIARHEEAYVLDFRSNQFKIELMDGNTGWVNAEDVTIREGVGSRFCDLGGQPAVPAPGVTPGVQPGTAQLVGPRVVINTGFLNLRSGPGAQFSVVTTLPGGAELGVVGVAPDGVWYLVQGNFGQAWLNNEFVLFRGDGSRLPVIREHAGATLARPVATITNAINLYLAPNVAAGVIGAISGPAEVIVVARTGDSAWVQLSTALGFGWARASEVTIRGDLSLIPLVP